MFYYPNNNYRYNNRNDRFIVPFLGGALLGGAAVGLTRPRPIYNVAPNSNTNYNPYYNQGMMPYYNSYSYYQGYRPY